MHSKTKGSQDEQNGPYTGPHTFCIIVRRNAGRTIIKIDRYTTVYCGNTVSYCGVSKCHRIGPPYCHAIRSYNGPFLMILRAVFLPTVIRTERHRIVRPELLSRRDILVKQYGLEYDRVT